MNYVAFNITRYRLLYKISYKKLSQILNTSPKQIKKWETGKEMPSPENIKKLAKLFGCNPNKFQNEAVVVLNLKEMGFSEEVDSIQYEIKNFKTIKENYISLILNMLVIIFLLILGITNSLPMDVKNKFLEVLKMIFIIELFVLPLIIVVLPFLKIYSNRVYEIKVLTKNEEYQDEIHNFIINSLYRSVNKSIFSYIVFMLIEILFVLYGIVYFIVYKDVEWYLICFCILSVIDICFSIYALQYSFNKKKNHIFLGDEK